MSFDSNEVIAKREEIHMLHEHKHGGLEPIWVRVPPDLTHHFHGIETVRLKI